MSTLFNIIIAAGIGYAIGRYMAYRAVYSLQNRGESLVSRTILQRFSGPDYHLMNSVTVQLEDGTTQIDHILISRFGVFVIETKDYNGWIFADAVRSTWTQVMFKRKFKFQNPIHQNFRHVRAVQALLDFLPPKAVTSAVVFTGKAEFKTPITKGVFTLESLCAFIGTQHTEILSSNRLQFCVGRLEANRLALTKTTDVDHVQSLQRRHGNLE